jgi:hypothetical protein
MKRKDTQIVELAGRNRLASELQKANIEVARPERDHGVDLLAYPRAPADDQGEIVGQQHSLALGQS